MCGGTVVGFEEAFEEALIVDFMICCLFVAKYRDSVKLQWSCDKSLCQVSVPNICTKHVCICVYVCVGVWMTE